jgi:glycosyltransferase involved in cell wall biosynthesis
MVMDMLLRELLIIWRLMRISVVSTCWNENKNITVWLDSLINQSIVPFEIVVVDNCSNDGTEIVLKRYETNYPLIKVITQKCTVAEGRHIAIEASQGDYILSADVGTIIPINWVESYEQLLRDNPLCDYIKGNYYFEYITSDSNLVTYDRLIKGNSSNLTTSSLASNRSVLYSRHLYNEVGGLDLRFSFAGDDTLLSFKMTKKANRILVNSAAPVGWIRPASFEGLLKEAANYGKGDGELMRIQGLSWLRVSWATVSTLMLMLIVGLTKLITVRSTSRIMLLKFHVIRSFKYAEKLILGYREN